VTTDDPVRPRYGTLTRRNGDQVLLVFHPSADDPTAFLGFRADTERPVRFSPGDSFTIDALGAGQSVTLALEEDIDR
jgi:hypothetical protein